MLPRRCCRVPGIDTAAAEGEDEDGSGATRAEDDAPSSGWPDWALALIGPQRGEPAVAVAWALLVIFFCALAHASVRLDSPWRRKHRLSPFLAIVLLTAAAAGFALDGWSCAALADAIGYPVGTAALAYVCEAAGALLLALAIVGPPAPPGGFADARHVGPAASRLARLAQQRPLRRVGLVGRLGLPRRVRAQRRAGLLAAGLVGQLGRASDRRKSLPCSAARRAAGLPARARLGQAQEALAEELKGDVDYESVAIFERIINDYLRREPEALERTALARGLGALVAAVGVGGFFFLPTAMVS